MDRLIRTPRPRRTESMLGYALRLSEANGYDTPWRVLHAYGAAGKKGFAIDISIPIVAKLVGCKPSILQPLANFSAIKGHEHDLYLLGQHVGQKFGSNPLRLGKPAFCPHCVMEDGFIDAKWDLSAMAACSKHHCEVIRNCHECGKQITYHRKGLLKCRCGADLSKTPVRNVPLQVAKIMQILTAKAHGKSILDMSNETNLPMEFIEAMPLAAFCELLQVLARHALNSRRGIAKIDGLLAASKSAEILSNWPTGYQSFLREIDNKFGSGNQNSVGLAARYKDFYASMFTRSSSASHFAFLRDELIRFGGTELGTCIVASNTAAAIGINKRWVSLSELCELWEVTPPTAKRILNASDIPMQQVGSSKRYSYLIDISGLDTSAFRKSTRISAKNASLLAGIPASVMMRLRRNGTFKVANPALRPNVFQVCDVERFCNAIIRKVELSTEERPPLRTTISLRRLLQVAKFGDRNGKAQFIESYLRGEVIPLGRFGETTGDILFDKFTIGKLGRQSRIDMDRQGYTFSDAGNILKCNANSIPTLLGMGYLKDAAPCDNKFRRLSKESVMNFATNWEAISSIFRDIRVHSRRIQRIADQNGIFRLVVTTRKQGGEFCSFVRKSDAEKLRELVLADIQQFGFRKRYPLS